MLQSFTRFSLIYLLTFFSYFSILNAQSNQLLEQEKPSFSSNKKARLDETRNRFPEILHDVKILLSEVLIADHHLDTLEVIYNLSRIYDLLMEADQIGDMNQEDQEEFERFEKSFLDIYTHKLGTIKSSDAPVTAERFRRDITDALEPLAIEMGDTKFIVVDDRDGHIPLVRNKQVDQFINYFQTKGRKQFEIWFVKMVSIFQKITLTTFEVSNFPWKTDKLNFKKFCRKKSSK